MYININIVYKYILDRVCTCSGLVLDKNDNVLLRLAEICGSITCILAGTAKIYRYVMFHHCFWKAPVPTLLYMFISSLFKLFGIMCTKLMFALTFLCSFPGNMTIFGSVWSKCSEFCVDQNLLNILGSHTSLITCTCVYFYDRNIVWMNKHNLVIVNVTLESIQV